MTKAIAPAALTGEIMDKAPEIAFVRLGLPTQEDADRAAEVLKAVLAKNVTPK